MNKISELLTEINPDADFQSSIDYIKDYLLDSFDIMTLVAGLEEIFSINIQINDILPENFKSLDSITDLVKKCGGTI